MSSPDHGHLHSLLPTDGRSLALAVGMGMALGAADVYMAGFTISHSLHNRIHGMEMSERARRVSMTAAWFLTGMAPIHWADHLAHHDNPEEDNWEAQREWNDSRPEGAPLAPIEPFAEPYGPKKHGFLRVMFNTARLHHKAYPPTLEFLHKLVDYDDLHHMPDKQHWPKTYQHIDITDLNPRLLINNKTWLGMVAHGVIEAAVFNPVTALTAKAIHVGGEYIAAGDINAIHHTGEIILKNPRFGRIKKPLARAAIMLGMREAVPDENGEYACDTTDALGFIEQGHQRHRVHHRDPSNPVAAGDTFRLNPPGLLARTLMLTNDASFNAPGYVPRPLFGKYTLARFRNPDGAVTLSHTRQIDVYKGRITRHEAVQRTLAEQRT